MFQYQWTLEGPNYRTIGGLKEKGTQKASGEDEPMWPMLEQETLTTVSLVARLDTLPRTAYRDKEKGKEELELTSLILTQKRILSMREAKLKEAG
jgi:hypothetical protein